MTHTIIDKLERADGPDRAMDFLIAIETDWRWPEWEEGEPTIKRLAEKHGLAWALSNDRSQSIWCGIPKFSGSIDAAMMLVPDGRKWSLQPGAKTSFKPFNERTSVKTDSERMEWFWVASVFGHRGESKTPAIALAAAALRARSQGGE